jgi:hypothetical protein
MLIQCDIVGYIGESQNKFIFCQVAQGNFYEFNSIEWDSLFIF